MKKSKISVGKRTPINARMPRSSAPVDCGNRAEPRGGAINEVQPAGPQRRVGGEEAPGLPVTGAIPRSTTSEEVEGEVQQLAGRQRAVVAGALAT